MATTEFNKEYLEYTKKEAKNWHLYLGGIPELTEGREKKSFDWGKDVNFLCRIKEQDVKFSTNRIDWKKRISVSPWVQNLSTIENNLVFNVENNIAYLCVSDNKDNRSDESIRGKNLSVIIPNHKTGEQTYEDGYTWYALFLVDPLNLNLITYDSIPVPDINDYSTDSKADPLNDKFLKLCGGSYKTTNGVCCLYNKITYKDSAGITQDKGMLSGYRIVSKCYECSDLALELNMEYNFISGVTAFGLDKDCTPCDCEYEIKTKMDVIKENIPNINPNSDYKFLKDSYDYWFPNKKGILSVFINLQNLKDDEKILKTESANVTFKTLTGSDGLAKLKTEPYKNQYIVTGIELISSGYGYDVGDAKPIIDGYESSILNDKIEVNITPENFPEIPHVMLKNMKTNISLNIDNYDINTVSGTNITQFTKYGIIKNVKLPETEIDAIDGLNENEVQIVRSTTILNMSPNGSDRNIGQNPNLLILPGDSVKLSDDDNKKGDVVYFKYDLDSNDDVTGAKIEIITKDYENIKVGDSIFINNNFKYVVDSINKPDVSFGTGTPLLNNDTNILMPDVDEIQFSPRKTITFNIKKS